MHRTLGTRNTGGGFEPSMSLVEALYVLPDEMVTVFLELDKVYGKMERQYMKQKGKKDG